MLHAGNSKIREKHRFLFEPALDSYCVIRKFYLENKDHMIFLGLQTTGCVIVIHKGYEKGCSYCSFFRFLTIYVYIVRL